jgi:hypothetical protein
MHSAEERSHQLKGQGLRHIPEQEETGRSETTETATPATLTPTQAEGWCRGKRRTRIEIGHK